MFMLSLTVNLVLIKIKYGIKEQQQQKLFIIKIKKNGSLHTELILYILNIRSFFFKTEPTDLVCAQIQVQGYQTG